MKREVEWQLTRNIDRIGHLEMAGGGQVVAQDGYVYVGHMKPPMGTSIIDVRDPADPKVVSHVPSPDNWSHCHKVRVVGDIMITNVEQDRRHFLRKGEKIAGLRAKGLSNGQIAEALSVNEADIAELEEAQVRGYHSGGFRIWDISDKSAPRQLAYVKTFGFGVHRFDMDANFAYISTEMDGYVGNILVVYDIADPANPTEVSRWHMPGQHIAGGETPTWDGYGIRLHHAMRCGNELWAAVWHAGYRVLDATDIRNLVVKGSYRFPEAIPEPTHTIMPLEQLIDGRRYAVAIDEEHDHQPGRLHGFLWVIDVTDPAAMEPVAAWDLSERLCPWVGQPGIRFGGHQFREKLDSTLVYAAWFAGGLRVLDLANPKRPVEVAHYMVPGADGTPPQSNDVDVDETGLIYLLDRTNGLEILRMTL